MSATATNGRVPRVVPEIEHAAGSALMSALLAVQAAAPELTPDADGQVGPRRYRYVTLGRVTAAVLPLLVEHDLAWVTFPTSLDGQPALRYRVTHVPSGEYQEDVMPLLCVSPDPQGQGSALTYARRYAIVAVLNLTTGEDDDGTTATTNGATAQPAAPPQPTARPSATSDRPASAKQRGMLQGKGQHLPRSDFANVVLQAAGDPPRVWADEDTATRWIKRALDRLPAKHVDAVLAGIAQADGSQA